MQTLAKAAMRSGKTGTPLPDVYTGLASQRVHFRRGGTSMIAGPPGAFKSTLALNLTCAWAAKEMTGIYVSADSDEFTVAKRCAGILSGDKQDKIEKTLKSGAYSDHLRKLRGIHWEFRGLSVQQLDLRLKAFEHMYGSFPDFVVIDNLMNCVDGPGDWNGQISMCRDLDTMARESSSHFVILHHTQEGSNSEEPPPRWHIMGKVAQFPRLILTVNAVKNHMMVACVKNTNGPQDPTGRDYRDFMISTDTYRIDEL